MDSELSQSANVKSLVNIGQISLIYSASLEEHSDEIIVTVYRTNTNFTFGMKEMKPCFYRIFKKDLIKSTIINEMDYEIITDWYLYSSKHCAERIHDSNGLHLANLYHDQDTFLQIHGKHGQSYNLKKLNKHGKVITSKSWGNVTSCNSTGTGLIYLAEKNTKKFSFSSFSNCISNGIDELNNKAPDEPTGRTNQPTTSTTELIWRKALSPCPESLLEQLNEVNNYAIVHLNLEKQEFTLFELPKKDFPCDIHLSNDKIIGSALPYFPWKHGLTYQNNKECRIFSLNTKTGDFEYLSGFGLGSFSPRVNPQGTFVIWQERSEISPYKKWRKIIGMPIGNESFGKRIELYNPRSGFLIYNDFPINCWARDGSSFFVNSIDEGKGIILKFDLKTSHPSTYIAQVTPIQNIEENVDAIHWISDNFLLYSTSSNVSSPSLHICSTSSNFENLRITRLLKLDGIKKELKAKLRGTLSSFYYKPPGDHLEKTLKLIVWPQVHPYMSFSDSYSLEAAFFIKIGYGVLLLNYNESPETHEGSTESLFHKIGNLDVKECQEIAEAVVISDPEINPEAIFIYGSTLGGFLAAHLISAFPNFYKAAVLINPVTDLSTLIGTIGFNDWNLESGEEISQTWENVTEYQFERSRLLHNCSPIAKAKGVKAGTLLLIGYEDFGRPQVPLAQGVNYFKALKSLNVNSKTEILIYPENQTLQNTPVIMDFLIHSDIWFNQFTK